MVHEPRKHKEHVERRLDSGKKRPMNKVSSQQRPEAQDRDAWHGYWRARGQPWRTEPEIDPERQAYLAERRAIKPDLEQGIYPFKDIKLNRADVEWLLVTHMNGRGPVDWHEFRQHARAGLDLRGADLRGADLGHLPLAHMLGGLSWEERDRTPERREMAAIHLEGAILSWAHLEGAELYMAYLSRADLYKAHLEGASLRKAHLEGVSLRNAHLEGKYLFPRKQGTRQNEHSMDELPPADLRAAFFDSKTDLRNTSLGDEVQGYVRLADVHWEGVNLGVVDWAPVKMLGDETRARRARDEEGNEKEKETRIHEYREAVRANRQLAVALQDQGLNEEAARFAYRAQLLQKDVQWRQGKLGAFLFSTFLDLLAGYGYKPLRSLVAYLLVIACFTVVYYFIGQTVGPRLSPLGALVFSLTSFHGRGLFTGRIAVDDPITVLAAFEAVVGLAIEISFIATFTRRFFGK